MTHDHDVRGEQHTNPGAHTQSYHVGGESHTLHISQLPGYGSPSPDYPLTMAVTALRRQRLVLQWAEHRTNHVLHLLLCIPTAGLWLVVWALVDAHNRRKRESIEKQLGLHDTP